MPDFSSNAARAADVLIAVGDAGADGLGLQALVDQLGESRSAVHRTLAALASRGLVVSARRRGSYCLGPAAHGLARRPSTVEHKLAAMRPVLYRIVAETGYTAFLMIECGLDALCLEMVSSAPIRSLTGGAGGRVPLGIAAGSLVLLAELPAESREAVMRLNAGRYARYPAVRPMSAGLVAQMVQDTHLHGYSCDFGHFFPNEGGIGVPVPSPSQGRSGLAVSISVHGEISGRDSLARLARRVSDIIAQEQPQR